ncbi:MAG: hypothetical protein K2K44_03645 [Oscillospiraceae bacterium]|nr:hypothetical protein [Oscillospiraceae bacterium]
MKKKLSLILAFLMAASIMAGCKKTEENTDGLPDITEPAVSITQMTTTTAEETTTTTTETTTEETSDETESETTSETTETTASETTSVNTTATAATASAAAAKDWNETEISETLYIKSSCYSRTRAIVGSDSVKKYSAGTRIEVVAATDTGYYKLADGTFIHSDYVTDEAPAAATTTKKPTTTKASEDDGLIIDDNTPAETTKKPSAGSASTSGKHPKSFKDRYPYKQLSAKEQELYQNIVEAAYAFSETADLPSGLDNDQIYRVYSMVYDNEPQLFWLSRTMPTALGSSIAIGYSYGKSDAEKFQAAIDKNRKEIMKSVNGYTSTISKLKVIYDWVIRNNSADVTAGADGSTIINGIGGYGVIQCQGYAKSILYLCDYAGIECMTVPGMNPEGSSHAWNIVYCDNGYYILDATWGDPQQDWGNKSYTKYIFFLANDEMTKNSHLKKATMTRNNGTVVKIFDPPACTKTSCYYFKAYNKEYSDLESATQAMYDEIDAAIKENRNVVHIRVTDKAIYDKLMSNDMWSKFQKYARKQSSKVDKVRQQPTFTEDLLVIDYDIIYK